ncbi:MAG: hypothetical protein PWQ41_353 [Bacillota bacterium]|nr:hypothetical protein [Bacillota bacterium]MDK2924579.1 hypothetical protein [Bacillota bacterium]
MNISFSAHFINRKRIRGIPDGLAETVFLEADERFRDVLTGMFIAVKHVPIAGKNRDVALTYTIKNNTVIFVTIHPLKQGQMENRVKHGRWVKYEP